MTYQQSVNNRREFARDQYEKILTSFHITKGGQLIDVISGYKARKLNQAFTIYSHYMAVSGYPLNGTAGFYNRRNAKQETPAQRNPRAARKTLP